MREIGIIAIVAATVITIVLIAAQQDARRWQLYSQEHHCLPVGKQESSVGIDVNGNTVYIDAKTIYHCDGGEVHIQ